MNIIEGNEKNFEEITSRGNVLVDFYATWFGPCKMLGPELEAIKDKVQIIKVNIDENLPLCQRFGVMSVPTLIYFKPDGSYEIKVGYMPKEVILEWLTQG